MMGKAKELALELVERYDFNCEAGPLLNCETFQKLLKEVDSLEREVRRVGGINMGRENQFIIVEGMDNTGKTTLIQRIIREYARGYSSAKVSLGPNCSEKEQRYWLEMSLEQVIKCPNDLLIFDRFLPICDTIYGNVLRGGSLWNIKDGIIKEILSKYNPLIIYCRPDMDKIIGFEDGRDQMEGVEENARLLVETYDETMDYLISLGYQVITYDYDFDLDKTIIENKIKSLL